jgi:uncharacterized protein YbjT (DUF2867 family)
MYRVLVTGATGRQGGSVVDALLADGVAVRAFTRDATSERARALSARGVEVVEGDLDRRTHLRRAMDGVDGVFLVTDYFSAGRAGEIHQGRNGVRAAAEAGVDHLVYSSVASADRAPGLEHFRTKRAVESYLHKRFPSATVLRPAYFMSNFESQRSAVADGRLALPLRRSTELALVDPRDIGRMAARAFADPERFAGRTVELAGDELTLSGMAAAFSEVLGRRVTPEHVRTDAAYERMGEEMADMFAWFNSVGYDVNVRRLEAETGVEMTRFREYLEREWADAEFGAEMPAPSV